MSSVISLFLLAKTLSAGEAVIFELLTKGVCYLYFGSVENPDPFIEVISYFEDPENYFVPTSLLAYSLTFL